MSEQQGGLRSANQNPWYCLATLFGEQTGAGYDAVMAARNRAAWNRWMTGLVAAPKFDALLARGIAMEELQPYQEVELQAFIDLLEARLPLGCRELPGPDMGVDFSRTFFEEPVSFEGFVFPTVFNIKNAIFTNAVSFMGAVFLGPAHFNGCAFTGYAGFAGVDFHGLADFRGTKFAGASGLLSARYLGDVNFGQSEGAWDNKPDYFGSGQKSARENL